jgi:pyruvate formate lyase activating enzyme
MSHQNLCASCIRACPLGASFCGRRDSRGKPLHPYLFCSLLVDFLFEKPIVHFTKNMRVLSIGTWGCNLRCLGCQNSLLSWTTTGDGIGFTEMKPGQVIQLARDNRCGGICYTFNEPAVVLESVEEIAGEARKAGLINVLVTNSTLTPVSARKIAPLVDVVAADIKSMDDSFYFDYCGAEGIRGVAGKILACIKTFHDCGIHVEIRTNIIPGANDSRENFHGIARWIRQNLGRDIPWHITRFFPAHRLSHLPATPTGAMIEAQKIGLEEGLRHVHTHFSKGCDCAGEKALIPKGGNSGGFSVESCCSKQGLPPGREHGRI